MQVTELNAASLDEQLRAIVADILDVEPSRVTLDAGPGRIESWDSLAHLSIITAVEEAYRVKFDMPEIQRINTFAALLKALSARLAP